ncbi:MAG: hypothetical protein AAB197_05870 [Deltaproteobacteria bacterium]
MKKEITFVSAMIVFGAALGIGIISIIVAIAAPDFVKTLLTFQEKADFELMQRKAGWIIEHIYFIKYPILLIAILTLALFFINLNPHVKSKLKLKYPGLKFLVIFLGVLASLILLIFTGDRISNLLNFDVQSPNAANFLIFSFTAGLLWFIAGEMGWAGDFSSWRMGVAGREHRPVFVFILGTIAGSAVYGLFFLHNWTFNKYFILVSEVLDKSGETSYLGFKLLAYELIFTTAISLGIIAGLIVALAPVYRRWQQRLQWFILPVTLSAVLAVVIFVVYTDAAKKYDLGKKDLAQAAGVPDKAMESLTLVLLKQDTATVQEWPLQARGSGFVSTGTVAATGESLKRIEDYLAEHKNGSVFTYAAQDALIRGHHVMWDLEKGLEYQFRYAENTLLHRLILLSRLRYLPVTSKNLGYLKALSDESKWYVGRDACLRIAEAFMHFGMTKEAQDWVNKGKERGADISKALFLKDKVLTQGRINGRVMVNGMANVSTRVALMRQDYKIDKIEDGSLIHKLIDVQKIGKDGSFTFSNIGKGDYLLIIVADKNIIPYDIASDGLKVKNIPGTVKIDINKPARDLGTMNIITQ